MADVPRGEPVPCQAKTHRKEAKPMTKIARRTALALAGAALAAPAHAQPAFPIRPIRILVPFAAGGTTDILARAIGERLSAALGQPVVIDNRGGAGGTVAGEAFARAEPDGHTLLVATASLICINKALYARLPFDPDTDFLPVAMLAQQPNVLVVNPRVLPMATLPELIAHIRANPGRINYGSSGTGSQLHLTGEMFRAAVGVDMAHVPYRGSAPAMTDLVAGRVDYYFDAFSTVQEHTSAGRIQILGVSTPTRAPQAPEVPTIAQAGLPGFSIAPWWGIIAPAGVPGAVLERLAGALDQALAQPAVATGLANQGCTAAFLPPAEFERFVRAEDTKWTRVIEAAGLRVS